MIYTGKVRPSILEEGQNVDVLDYFQQYQPIEIHVPDDDKEQKRIKTQVADGFISGEVKALIRKNENVLSRDCLILDLDDVIVSETELIELIEKKFQRFDYVLYPTISHHVKGVRYRLVIPLDQSTNEQEYKLLITFFSKKLLGDVINEADLSNGVWSQIQLLPVITQYVTKDSIIISKGEKRFPTVEGLSAAAKWQQDTGPKQLDSSKFKRNASRYRNTTTELFESLVSGCREGNRNNRIAQITGGLLARAVDVKKAYELVIMANEHFAKPLEMEELNQTFYSIAKKELSS